MIVLVVEDEFMIAKEVESSLRVLGHHVLGPVATVGEALQTLDEGPLPDAAILDLNLRGATSIAVAEELSRHRIPFAFASGYDADAKLQQRFTSARWLRKPYTEGQMQTLLDRIGAERLT